MPVRIKIKVICYDKLYMFQCSICGSKFAEEKRLKIHFKTHEKREAKGKKQKRVMPDFEKPDFSQVNI